MLILRIFGYILVTSAHARTSTYAVQRSGQKRDAICASQGSPDQGPTPSTLRLVLSLLENEIQNSGNLKLYIRSLNRATKFASRIHKPNKMIVIALRSEADRPRLKNTFARLFLILVIFLAKTENSWRRNHTTWMFLRFCEHQCKWEEESVWWPSISPDLRWLSRSQSLLLTVYCHLSALLHPCWRASLGVLICLVVSELSLILCFAALLRTLLRAL